MPPGNHARLSASSAHRWLECPPSVAATEHLPDETSIFAKEGSAAHEAAEYKVRWYLGERDMKPPSTGQFDWHRQDGRTAEGWLLQSKSAEQDEIDRHTDTYAFYAVDKIEEIRKNCPDAIVLVEQRLDFSNYVEDGFGTGDLVIVADDVIHVITALSEQWDDVSEFDGYEADINLYKVREMEQTELLQRLITAYDEDFPEMNNMGAEDNE